MANLQKISIPSLFLVIISGMIIPAYSDPGAGTLFGTDAFNGNLITINPANGNVGVVGPTGAFSTPSLASDPTTGIMYMGTGIAQADLYTVNTGTGFATIVGNSGLGFAAISAMDFRGDGVLFASVNIAGDGGTGGDHLATLDKANGIATIIGPFGPPCIGVSVPSTGDGSCILERMEAIAFAPDGTLLGATSAELFGGSGELYTIDTSTGEAILVALILDSFGQPHPGGIASLQFACDGTLYAGTAKGGNLGFADFLTINPTNGLFNIVGSQALIGSSLGGLAFGNICPTNGGIPIGGELIPLDTTMILLAGTQMTAAWLIPVIVSAIGIGIVIARKF